jgi:hypothetical protein
MNSQAQGTSLPAEGWAQRQVERIKLSEFIFQLSTNFSQLMYFKSGHEERACQPKAGHKGKLKELS